MRRAKANSLMTKYSYVAEVMVVASSGRIDRPAEWRRSVSYLCHWKVKKRQFTTLFSESKQILMLTDGLGLLLNLLLNLEHFLTQFASELMALFAIFRHFESDQFWPA